MRLAQVDSGTGPVVVEVAGDAARPLAYHADLTTLIRSGADPHCLPRGGWFPEPLELVAPIRPGKIIAVGAEVELAVVIGRRLEAANRTEALAGVFGYQLGPVVVTADEIGDVDVAEILSFASAHVTLEPGDVVLTGSEVEDIDVRINPVLALDGPR